MLLDLFSYVAVDDFEFKYDEQDCQFLPEVAKPSDTTTTSAPSINFPDCQFDNDECGWGEDEGASMKWRRTTTMSIGG